MRKIENEPLQNIRWMPAAQLNANDYNPNVVFTPELKLLQYSIIATGWVQPVLVNPDLIIIDGFHRTRLALEPPLLKRYDGYVPCCVINVDRAGAMLMTIRINRAKGTHVALRMSAVVHELIDTHGMAPGEIAEGIGASLAEVDLLYQDGIFKARNIKDYKYGKAWYPAEGVRE